MRPSASLAIEALPRLPDADVYELHREIAREAQKRRLRDPVYQSHYKQGVAAGRAKWERHMAKVMPERYGEAATDAAR